MYEHFIKIISFSFYHAKQDLFLPQEKDLVKSPSPLVRIYYYL